MVISTQITEFRPELSWRPSRMAAPGLATVGWGGVLKLDTSKDYVIKLPDTPLTSGLAILGGRNYTLIGGEIRTADNRALYINGNAGTAYIEGLRISGPGTKDGIVIDSRLGGDIVIQNTVIEEAHGTQDGYHADLLQTWAGPRRLLVDHFYGRSDYQGLFLHPSQQWSANPGTEVDLRHVELDLTQGNYALWAGSSFQLDVHDVWVRPNPARSPAAQWNLMPNDARWNKVKFGSSPVPMVDTTPGIGYQSYWG